MSNEVVYESSRALMEKLALEAYEVAMVSSYFFKIVIERISKVTKSLFFIPLF